MPYGELTSGPKGHWRLDICVTKKRGWASPVASRHPLPQGEGEQSVWVWLKPTFQAVNQKP